MHIMWKCKDFCDCLAIVDYEKFHNFCSDWRFRKSGKETLKFYDTFQNFFRQNILYILVKHHDCLVYIPRFFFTFPEIILGSKIWKICSKKFFLSGNRENAEFLKIQKAIKTGLMGVMSWNFAQWLTFRCRLGLLNCFFNIGVSSRWCTPGWGR